MRKFLGTLILYLLFVTNTYSLENRVISYADDGLEAWFTFEYSKKDIFTLSFAGSGPYRGIWIVEGKLLDPLNTICLLETDDQTKKLQNLIMNKFMTNYGLGGEIKVDPNRTLGIIKGKISNTILYYFLRAAQDSKNTEDYLANLNCND